MKPAVPRSAWVGAAVGLALSAPGWFALAMAARWFWGRGW